MKLFQSLFYTLVLFLLQPNPLFAQDKKLQTNIDSSARAFFNIKTIDQFLPNVLQVGLTIGAVSTLFYLIWGGIEYLTSGGNQERNKSAKAKISTAIAGLAILASVWAIWRLVVYFLGIAPSVRGPLKLLIPTP